MSFPVKVAKVTTWLYEYPTNHIEPWARRSHQVSTFYVSKAAYTINCFGCSLRHAMKSTSGHVAHGSLAARKLNRPSCPTVSISGKDPRREVTVPGCAATPSRPSAQGINRIDEEDAGSQEASPICDELLHEEVAHVV
jgi:hypothetical protein